MGKKKIKLDMSLAQVILLTFQIVLWLFNIFGLNYSVVYNLNKVLYEATPVFNIMGLIGFFDCIYKILSKSNKIKKINIYLTVANLLFLNKYYNSHSILRVWDNIKSFIIEKNIPGWLVISFVALLFVVFLVAAINRQQKTSLYEPNLKEKTNTKIVQDIKETNHKNSPNLILEKNGKEELKKNNFERGLLLFIVLLLLFLVGLAIYFLITRYDLISQIINDAKLHSNYITYIMVAISIIAVLIVLLLFITIIAKRICSMFVSLPQYLKEGKFDDAKLIKGIISILLIPILYWITKSLDLNVDWLLEKLDDKNFLVAPFIAILYFILAIVLVEVFAALFLRSSEHAWTNRLVSIAKYTGKNIVKFSDSLIKSFLRLINFIPDFLESLEDLLGINSLNSTTEEKEKNE